LISSGVNSQERHEIRAVWLAEAKFEHRAARFL
jgi:hypothetical protein